MAMGWKINLAVLMACCAGAASADDDAGDRIAELQKMLEQQQWQMKAMAEELKALQQNRSDDKGKSTGSPVYAAFKDGITFEDGSGNWQLAINGRIQADYRTFTPDESAAETFSLRRARLGGTATFYKDFVARVEGEYSGGSTTLTYGYFDINRYKQAKIRLGQFKPFYGLERSMSSNFTDFQERSWADSLLGSTYDRGVMVHGAPLTGVYYSLAYLNGTGTADENNVKNDNKDFTLRLTANLAEMAKWQDAVVHVGGWWGNGREGSRRQASFIPTMQTEGRGVQFFNTTCSAGACGTATASAFKDNVERDRGGFETALAYGPVKLQGEFIKTSFESVGYDRELNAWYTSVMWNVTGETFAGIYKDGVFGRLKPKNNYKFGADGWGAFQLGARYSRFDGSDFKAANVAGTGVLSTGVTNEAHAWTLGANWILNPNTRLLMNYVYSEFDDPVTVSVNGVNQQVDSEHALTMRAQFDF